MTKIPVIGVFGSDVEDTLERAEKLGRAVARRRGTLLTGGGRKPREKSVKERAMVGARRGRPGPGGRIGLLGKEVSDVWVESTGDELIMALGYGDRRNLVNAMVCDVAIAFPGGAGTVSEVAFALALERPVILLGDAWTTMFPIVRTEAAYDAFVATSQCRVPLGGEDPVDALVDDAYRRLTRDSGSTIKHRPLDHPAKEVARLAAKLARRDGYRGVFPSLEDRRDLVRDFNVWLTRLEEEG